MKSIYLDNSDVRKLRLKYRHSINNTKIGLLNRINTVIDYMEKHQIDTVNINLLNSIWKTKKTYTKALIKKFSSTFENIQVNTYRYKYPTWEVKNNEERVHVSKV